MLCCGGNCYPDLPLSNTTICCGNVGFDASQTGTDHAYCCGDTLFTYDGPDSRLNCCNPQTSTACLGTQTCCHNGTCTPLGTDCPTPGQTCGDGQFVCGDRCGSYDFGDTCCPTSNGQAHLLCGVDTQCCGDGCCLNDWICTSTGGCTPVPSLVPHVGSFVSNSCVVDNVKIRVLSMSFVDQGGMTVEECVQHAGSHKYAAVEYADECYWGDSLTSFRTRDSSSCFMRCSGNVSEICGGESVMNLYINEDFVPSSTITTSSSTTASSAPSPTLTRADILSILIEAQNIINHINDLLHQWQAAIQSATGRSIKILLKRQSQTTTVLQEEIVQQGFVGGNLQFWLFIVLSCANCGHSHPLESNRVGSTGGGGRGDSASTLLSGGTSCSLTSETNGGRLQLANQSK